MSGSPTVTDDEQAPPVLIDTAIACLDPSAPFPDDVTRLSLLELHVWHSRIRRQLDQDLLTPEGPHPLTLDRQQELVAELDARGSVAAVPGVAL